MNGQDVIRLLEADGWVLFARKGSHAQFRHPGRVTIPTPRHDIPQGTLRSIERQAGLALRQS